MMRLDQIKRELDSPSISYTFVQAATRFLNNDCPVKSRERAGYALKKWVPRIGLYDLRDIHDETLSMFISDDRDDGIKSGTVKRELGIIRRILTLASRRWRGIDRRPWLEALPLLTMPNWNDARKPYPISYKEQAELMQYMPDHLAVAILFITNTGLRDCEYRNLRWDWEIPGENLFVLPGDYAKNGDSRLIVCNSIASSVIEQCRGANDEFVFTNTKGPWRERIGKNTWSRRIKQHGLPDVVPHDLRHTFGRRLRSSGVENETRADLLGHRTKNVTTDYSQAEIDELRAAVELLEHQKESPVLSVVRGKSKSASRKFPARAFDNHVTVDVSA